MEGPKGEGDGGGQATNLICYSLCSLSFPRVARWGVLLGYGGLYLLMKMYLQCPTFGLYLNFGLFIVAV